MQALLHSPLRLNVFGIDDAAFASMAVGALSAGASMYNNIRQRKEQRELMDKSIESNIQQWNRENQYNTPDAQMKRFQAAGLNPNLIYGQSNTASSMTPSADVPEAKMPHNSVMEGLSAMQNVKQLELMDAQINNLNQNAQTNAAREKAILNGIKLDDQRLQIMWQRLGQDGQRLADEMARNAHLNAKTDEERKLISEQILNAVAERNEIAKNIELMDVKKASIVLDNIKKQFDVEHQEETWRRIQRQVESEIERNRALAGASEAEARLSDAERNQIGQQIRWFQRTWQPRLQQMSNDIRLQELEAGRAEQQVKQMKADFIASLDDVYKNARLANKIDSKLAAEMGVRDVGLSGFYDAVRFTCEAIGFSSGFYAGSHSSSVSTGSSHNPVVGFGKRN